MTAPSDWSAHLAAYEAGDVALLRVHLNNGHYPETLHTYGLVSPHANVWTCQSLHRHLHGADHPAERPAEQPAEPAAPADAAEQFTFGTGAPA